MSKGSPKSRSQAKKVVLSDNCVIEKSDFADFLGTLPDGSVDLVLTDPPYTISRDTGFKNVGKKSVERLAISMNFGKWDLVQIDLDKLATGMKRALRTGGTAIVWYDLWKITDLARALEKAGFKMLRLIVWEKTNPVPINTTASYMSNAREVAVLCVKGGKATFNSRYDIGTYRLPIPRHNGRKVHPTQKPLDLFQTLIEKHSNPGDLVVDPFLGSGTTAVAAIKEERRFSGCDINMKYVRSAIERAAEIEAEKIANQAPYQLEDILKKFRSGSLAELFLELAEPCEQGFSRKVSVAEFKGKYKKLIESSGSWHRQGSFLRKSFHVVRNEKGKPSEHFQLKGFNTHIENSRQSASKGG